jgi:hypothetical protein
LAPHEHAPEPIRRLKEALEGYGFTVDTRDGRNDLSTHTGLAVSALSLLFDAHEVNEKLITSICETTGLPASILLYGDDDAPTIVTAHPYSGGKPVRIVLPQEWGQQDLARVSFFFLHLEGNTLLSGYPDGTMLIGMRAAGSPAPGRTYTVEDEDTIRVLRCSATLEDGTAILTSAEDASVRVTIGAPKRLQLASSTDASWAPEPQITGRIVYAVLPVE